MSHIYSTDDEYPVA